MTLSLWDLKHTITKRYAVTPSIMTLSLWDLKLLPLFIDRLTWMNYDTIPMGFETG